jgi:uncharacterized protein (TIGR03000 family)
VVQDKDKKIDDKKADQDKDKKAEDMDKEKKAEDTDKEKKTEQDKGKKTDDDKKKKDDDDTAAAAAPARITVVLPVNARLTIDGQATVSTSARREFVSPALPTGQAFRYTFQAEFVRDGKTVVEAKDVIVRAGQATEVRFTADLTSVAAR